MNRVQPDPPVFVSYELERPSHDSGVRPDELPEDLRTTLEPA